MAKNPHQTSTRMVNPPEGVKTDAPEETKTEQKKEKGVKIKLLRESCVNGKPELFQAGTVLTVSEEEASQLCAPKLGQYSFGGEREGTGLDRHNLTKAVRL